MPSAESTRVSHGMTFTETVTAVGVASGVLVPASGTRRKMIIGPPLAGTVTISTKGTAVLGQGLTIGVGQAPIVLDDEAYGIMVSQQWTAIATGATNCNVFEVFNLAG